MAKLLDRESHQLCARSSARKHAGSRGRMPAALIVAAAEGLAELAGDFEPDRIRRQHFGAGSA